MRLRPFAIILALGLLAAPLPVEAQQPGKSPDTPRRRWKKAHILLPAMLITGCTYVAALDTQIVSERLPFLRDGHTTQQEVLNRLGEPTSRYEGGRILTYVMREDLNDRLHIVKSATGDGEGSWHFAIYKLVLVFGPDDVLERHSLVRVE